MNRSFVFSILSFFLMQNLAPAEHHPVRATCDISCTVEDIAEWSDESFPAINLGKLTKETRETSGSSSLILYTNRDVQIIADNSGAAQLSKDGAHTLVTQYKLEYYGGGKGQTQGGIAGWSDYDCFLADGFQATHLPGVGAIEIILSVRTFKNDISANESGEYSARQTLTVCWK